MTVDYEECPFCNKRYKITKNGSLPKHKRIAYRRPMYPVKKECQASGLNLHEAKSLLSELVRKAKK